MHNDSTASGTALIGDNPIMTSYQNKGKFTIYKLNGELLTEPNIIAEIILIKLKPEQDLSLVLQGCSMVIDHKDLSEMD